MATLYIAELSNTGVSNTTANLQIAAMPPIAEQTVAIAAGSAQSNAFNGQTKYVRLHTDSICSVAFGANPTATATNARLAAGTTEYFAIPQNQSFKVAVITNT